jgi:tetratricopeptide (TPR) repeat protein
MAEQQAATSRSSGRRRRRRVAVPLGLAVSIALVVIADRSLRARQDVVHHLATGDTEVLLPMSEYLREQVGKKTTWNDLHARMAAAQDGHDDKHFYESGYELAKFMEGEIGRDDPRRRELLLRIVSHAPEAPQAASAYWELLNPAWRQSLRGSYPRYSEVLTGLARSTGGGRLMELARLADEMRQLDEPELELKALRELRSGMRVSMLTEQPMRRLLEVLPRGDADLEALAADLAAFELHRRQLRAAAEWYSDFSARAARAEVEEIERLRAAAPQGPHNAFIASADARLADAYLRAGRHEEAQRLRGQLAEMDPGDMEEASLMAAELAEESIDPQQPPNKAPTGAPPDAERINFHRWRGLLLTGRLDEASALLEGIAGKDKTAQAVAEEERLLLAGELSKLSPRVNLETRTTNLPPELTGASRAQMARIELQPAGKAVPADIKSWVELWVTEDHVFLVARADEPRTLRAPSTRPRDSDLSREEHFQFVFNPDRWFDFQYVIDVNRAGSVRDGVLNNNGSAQRRQHRMDWKPNLDVQAEVRQDADGWTARVLLPRQQVLPKGVTAIRFNARRTRWITEKNQPTLQNYTWSPKAPSGEQRPEQLGWVIIDQ